MELLLFNKEAKKRRRSPMPKPPRSRHHPEKKPPVAGTVNTKQPAKPPYVHKRGALPAAVEYLAASPEWVHHSKFS